MKKIVITVLLANLITFAFAQTKYLDRKVIDRLTDSIEAEGKALYRSEWASWYGTDIFMEKCANKRALIGGYISYETKGGMYNVFYTKGDNPDVIGTISFGNEFNPTKYSLDTTARKLTSLEKEYYAIRTAAMQKMSTDTIFKYYKNSNLNPVPMLYNGKKQVFVLTGPTTNGIILYGNDYLLNFNKKNEVISIKKLHNSLISIKSGREQDSTKIVLSSMHSHVEGKDPFITATDICTTMLYKQYTSWNTMVVISKNYVSNWDCAKNRLVILTMEAWDNISKSQSLINPSKN